MNSSITEELFFTGLIGNVSIDSIIPYILKMETAEYNSQNSDHTEWTTQYSSVHNRLVRELSLGTHPLSQQFSVSAWYQGSLADFR